MSNLSEVIAKANEIKPFINNKNVYLTRAGSYSYGTNIEESDIDIRGFYLDSVDELLSISSYNIAGDIINIKYQDTVLYSIRKFLSLCLLNNPNILELLGTRKEDIIIDHELNKYYRQNIDMILSKRAYFQYKGYINSIQKEINKLGYQNIKSYKNFMHIFRLYLTGIDLFKTGQMNTYRSKEKDFLIEVRKGKRPVEELMDLNKDLSNQFEDAYKNTKLPELPYGKEVNAHLVKYYKDLIINEKSFVSNIFDSIGLILDKYDSRRRPNTNV